ncbi:MAG: hypothetical protein VX984_03880 [Thermodesulfobacteriota bacterium]|nr:hypothetical protein [Thermodesulfobacteriota bacterium]|tara:strand:- start:25428 stop:25649 length:222 start_codon:yes stop_codon:yes gene_type:complete
MSRNLKLVITSILSVVILIALTGFFALAFVGILIIYFILRFYKKVKPSKKKKVDKENKENKYVDIDEDDYTID